MSNITKFTHFNFIFNLLVVEVINMLKKLFRYLTKLKKNFKGNLETLDVSLFNTIKNKEVILKRCNRVM